MKRSVFLLLFLLIPTALAVDISLSKESYQPQELLQAEITGSFTSLKKENVQLFKDGKVHPEPVINGLTRQNNIYYFYAVLPREPGNYSIRIEDAVYLERGSRKTEMIEKNFTLIFKNSSDLSINPGFFIPPQELTLKIKSVYGNTEVTVTFQATGETIQLPLIEQIEEEISFPLPETPFGQSKILVGDYEIPVFSIEEAVFQEITLAFLPSLVEGTITSNRQHSFTVVIINSGQETIENINLLSDLDLIIDPETIDILEPNSPKVINVTISVSDITELSGKITAEFSNFSIPLPFSFDITSNESEVEIKDSSISNNQALSCSQLGNLCSENQFCDGDTIESLEGPCCIGTCSEQDSSTSTYIGIILFVILIIIIGFVVWKARQRKKIKSPEDILKDKSSKFKDRMQGKPSNEVSGKLDNV